MATINFRLNRPSQNGKLKGEPVSILVQLYTTGVKVEMATGERIIPKYWNKERQEARSTMTGHTEINLHLTTLKQDLLQLWRDNKTVDKEQYRQLMQRYLRNGGTVEKKTVLGALDALISQYSIEKDKKTRQKFSSLKVHLEKFAKKNPLNFESLDFGFYDKFKNFLYEQPNPVYPKLYLHNQGSYWTMSKIKSPYLVGLMDDTVYKYVINLKIFLRWASKRSYPVIKSYEEWPIIQREYEPITLNMHELKSIEEVEINSQSVVDKLGVDKAYLPNKAGIIAKALDTARDYLSLECRTAQRISDLLRFDVNDVSNSAWTFTQNKGSRLKSKQVTVPFKGYCAPAYWILQKHNFQLPKISSQKINDNIKNVCKMAGLTNEIFIERWIGNKKVRITGKKYEFISTHTGRKTFITLGLQLGVPQKTIMELSGITSYRTLKRYEGASESAVVEQWLEKMEDNMSIMRKAQ